VPNIKSISVVAIVMIAFSYSFVLAETLNPNYGTTTLFSQKDDKPVLTEPIIDTGAGAGGGHNSKNKNNSNNNNNNPTDSNGSIFGQIIGGIGALFGGSTAPQDSTGKTSLFDWQKNSDQNSGDNSSNDSSDSSGGEVIMGPRGESLENLSPEEQALTKDKFAKLNFKDGAVTVAPKKSKLLFTNVIVPVDMTTQYVIIISVFVIAGGGAVGYYLWKKQEAADSRKYNTKNDD